MGQNDLKMAIYEKLSPRRKKFIDKIGFDKWDPYQEPNHPIETRRDITKRTASDLVHDFFETLPDKDLSPAFERGVREFCLGIFTADERYRGMFEFSLWYSEQLKKEGRDPKEAWER